MASTGEQGEVKLWHFKSDMRPFKYTLHSQSVYSCNYSPCGGYLATGGQDGKVIIWKNVAEADKFNHSFKAHAGPVKSVRFSKDGNFLLSAGDDKIIKLYRVSSGYKKTQFLRSFVGHTNWVLKADISPDSNIVASICEKTVRLWDATNGDQILKYKNVETGNRCLEIHPEGNYIAIGGESGLLQIWDSRAEKLAQVYDTSDPINEINFHPSGQFIATAHDYSPAKNNSVLKIFDIRQGRCIYKITGVYGSLYGLKFSSEGSYLGSAGSEKLVYVWKTNFKPLTPLIQGEKEQQELIEAENAANCGTEEQEIHIGGALSLEQQCDQINNQKKSRAYEKLTMTLESLVSSINSISQNMARLESKLESNERRTKEIMGNIEFREQLAHKDPRLDTRGYLESVSKQMSTEQSQINLFTKKETYASEYSSTFNYTGTVAHPKQTTVVEIAAEHPQGQTIRLNTEQIMQNETQGCLLEDSAHDESSKKISYSQSMRFDSRSLIERCVEDRIRDEENLDQNEQQRKDFLGTQGSEEEAELNEEELGNTVEKKLTSTSEIELHAANRTIIGGAKKHDGVADESTRRDINFTATGLSYALVDETNPAPDSIYLSGTANPLPEHVYFFGSHHQESLKYDEALQQDHDSEFRDPRGLQEGVNAGETQDYSDEEDGQVLAQDEDLRAESSPMGQADD